MDVATRRDAAAWADTRGRKPARLARPRAHGPRRPAGRRVTAEMLGVRADRRLRRSSSAPKAKGSSAVHTRLPGSNWRPHIHSSSKSPGCGWACTERMRLSGRLATEWAAADAADGRTPSVQDVLRDARLRLDSELDTPPDRLAAAATLALSFTDLELAERLSRAALVATEHPEALFALGMALTGQAQGAEATDVLERYAQIVPRRRSGRRDGSWRHAVLAASPAEAAPSPPSNRPRRPTADRAVDAGCARCAHSSRCSSATLRPACASSPRSRPRPTPSARSCRPGRRRRRSRCRVGVTTPRMPRPADTRAAACARQPAVRCRGDASHRRANRRPGAQRGRDHRARPLRPSGAAESA